MKREFCLCTAGEQSALRAVAQCAGDPHHRHCKQLEIERFWAAFLFIPSHSARLHTLVSTGGAAVSKLFQVEPDDDQPIPQIRHHVPDHPQFHQDVVGQVFQAEGALAELAGAEQGKGLVHPFVPGLTKALLVEFVALEQIAQRQRDEVEQEHEQRLVLEREQDAVAAALLALEGIVLDGTGAGAADVVASGRRAEHILIACVVGAPAEVHVFKVGEEVFVEAADLVQDALAVERCAAAGREDALRFGIAAGPAAVAGLTGKAHPGDVVPGVVGQFAVEVADHQALHGEDPGVGLGGADELRQPLRLSEGVVVEEHHEFALGAGDALIDRMGEAGVAAVLDEGKVRAGAIAAGLLQTFVGGAVVHDDEFKILFGLGIDGLDGVPEPALAVDVGDDDGCFHIYLLLQSFGFVGPA